MLTWVRRFPGDGPKRPSSPSPPEHTAHTYTHTPFSPASGVLLDIQLSHFRFPLGRPNPKYPSLDHPDGAGSCTIGRNPIGCTKALFFRSSSCVLIARHTTNIRASAFPSSPAITIATYRLGHFEFCVFSDPLSRGNGAEELVTLNLTSSGLLSFFSLNIPRYDNPGSDPQEPWHRRQKPGPA